MIEKPYLRDVVVAESLDKLSWLAGKLPALANHFGTVDSITGRPVRWQRLYGVAQNPAYGQWVGHKGIKSSGRTPRDYLGVAVMTVDKKAIDELVATYDGQHAAAYVLGSVAMVGTSEYMDVFGDDPNDEHRYAMGMGIGKGAFQGLPGVLARSGIFYSGAHADLRAAFMRRQDVPAGVPIV